MNEIKSLHEIDILKQYIKTSVDVEERDPLLSSCYKVFNEKESFFHYSNGSIDQNTLLKLPISRV